MSIRGREYTAELQDEDLIVRVAELQRRWNAQLKQVCSASKGTEVLDRGSKLQHRVWWMGCPSDLTRTRHSVCVKAEISTWCFVLIRKDTWV